MKKFLFLLLFSPILFAQEGMFSKDPIINKENWNKQRVHWGYYLGFNSLDFKFDYLTVTEDVQVQTTSGFNVGLIGNLRLTEYFDLRFEPGLYYYCCAVLWWLVWFLGRVFCDTVGVAGKGDDQGLVDPDASGRTRKRLKRNRLCRQAPTQPLFPGRYHK